MNFLEKKISRYKPNHEFLEVLFKLEINKLFKKRETFISIRKGIGL